MPLGLLIREDADAIVVTGALPDYGAFGRVRDGDIVRAVTAYPRSATHAMLTAVKAGEACFRQPPKYNFSKPQTPNLFDFVYKL